MAEQDLIERIAQYMPNGNKVLAGHMARLFDEYTQNGVPAQHDAFDFDQILGDSQISYGEKKSRLIDALMQSGYYSEKEMMLDNAVRAREENRLLNQSDKEKREEAALVESEETKARFNQALERIAQGGELEKVIGELLPEMRKFQEFLDMVLSGEYSNGCIISGPAGTSKTHRVLSELKKRNLPFEAYNAHASALGLYELFHANKNGIVVLDDLESLLEDKRAIGVLKAASFSATGLREVTWNSTTKVLVDRGLPTRFVFDGKIIIILNNEYETRNESFKALLSRMPIFKLRFSMDSRKILVRSIIMKQDIFGLADEAKKNVLEYMEGLLDYSKTDNYNLRTAIRAIEIYKLRGEEGKPLIADLLGVDELMRKFLLIEDKAKHLPVGKRVEIWKNYTGYSRSAYHDLKSKYFSDKYDCIARMEHELEELEEVINEVGGNERL